MASNKPLAEALAKELGYKDLREMKESLTRGGGFAEGVKGRLSEGQGIGESLKGGLFDAKEGLKQAFSAKSIKQKAIQGAFGGDDILSAYMRGKFKGKKPESKSDSSPTKENDSNDGGGLGQDSTNGLAIIAKNSMSLPGIARDMNVLRQNLQQLVKIKAGPQKKGSKAYATGADSYFLSSKERESKLESEMAAKNKVSKPSSTSATGSKPTTGGGIAEFLSTLGSNIVSAAKTLFNPKNLMKVIGKLALPLLIISTLFSGIMDGFKKYQETGSFSEAIVAGLGGMLSFLTLGLLGEDTLKQVFDSLNGVFKPVLDTVSGIFDSVKGFFKNIFGDTIDVKEVASSTPKEVIPKLSNEVGATNGMPEIPKGLVGDLGNVMESMAKGDLKGVQSQAEAMQKKYPSQGGPKEETAEEQSARNYELNKRLTSEVSGALGIDLSMPAPPSPMGAGGSASLPASKDQPAPDLAPAGSMDSSPTPVSSELASTSPSAIDGSKSTGGFTINIAGRELQFKNQDEYYEYVKNPQSFAISNIGGINTAIRLNGPIIDPNKPISGSTTITAGGSATESSGSSISAASLDTGPISGSSTSGASLSTASTEIAEAQRMESAADQGSVINAPTTNNSSGSTGKPNTKTASAYDMDFAHMLATT